MSKTKKVNKAEAIRETIQELGPECRNSDVIKILEKKGIDVSSGQVSATRHAVGAGGKQKLARVAAKRGPRGGVELQLHHLQATKALVENLGGVENVQAAIKALSMLNAIS